MMISSSNFTGEDFDKKTCCSKPPARILTNPHEPQKKTDFPFHWLLNSGIHISWFMKNNLYTLPDSISSLKNSKWHKLTDFCSCFHILWFIPKKNIKKNIPLIGSIGFRNPDSGPRFSSASPIFIANPWDKLILRGLTAFSVDQWGVDVGDGDSLV